MANTQRSRQAHHWHRTKFDGLANTLSGKQPTIGSSTDLVVNQVTFGSGVDAILFNGDLSSYATTGSLSSGLAAKQDTISDSAPIALSNVTGLSTALSTKQDTISDSAPIALSNVTGLSTALSTKQDTISDSAPIALSNVTGLSTALSTQDTARTIAATSGSQQYAQPD